MTLITNIPIIMSVSGLLANAADLLLTFNQKNTVNHFAEVIWYKLASVKTERLIDRARSRWLFIAALIVPIMVDFSIAYFRIDLAYALATAVLMIPSLICASPFVWWTSRSNSVAALATRAIISGVALYCITDGLMWLGAKWFVEDTDDLIVWRLFLGRALKMITVDIHVGCVVLTALPVPMAYLGIGVVRVLEFVFRRCIESNKGGSIGVCILVGGAAALYKLFV
jgi:hypothetical protein